MKKFIIFTLFVAVPTFAVEQVSLSLIADQYKERGWNSLFVKFSRSALLSNYSEVNNIEKIVNASQLLRSNIASMNAEDTAFFFPNENILSDSDRIELDNKLQENIHSYTLLSKWHDFLATLSTERWNDILNDNGESLCSLDIVSGTSPIDSGNCGRMARGNYVVANLPLALRKELPRFLEIVIDDINYANSLNENLPIGPELMRVFHVLFNKKAIASFISPNYLISSDIYDSLGVTNRIAIIQAMIIQAFQDSSGLLRNSDFEDIALEDTNCDSSDVTVWRACQLKYLQNLVIRTDPDYQSSGPENLLLDPIFVEPFFSSTLTLLDDIEPSEVSNSIDSFGENSYDFFSLLIGVPPESVKIDGTEFSQLNNQLLSGIEYLIRKGSLPSLLYSKKVSWIAHVMEDYYAQ